jgi:hypothetical protein
MPARYAPGTAGTHPLRQRYARTEATCDDDPVQRADERRDGIRIAWSADLPAGPRATGRALLRELGADDVTAVCPSCGGAHGRPLTSAGQASIAHADGVTLVALGEHPLGVDLERSDAQPPGTTAQHWTEIEAVLKAGGRGLEVAPERIRFAGDGHAVLDGVVYVLDKIAIDGFVATLARARAAPATAVRTPRILPHPRRPR